MSLNIVLADDSAMLREALGDVLVRAGHTVVAVPDAEALHAQVARATPDIAIIDIRMPPTHTVEGIRAGLALRAERPGLPVLLLSQRLEVHHLADLLKPGEGGLGYLLKDRVASLADFVATVTRVAAGGFAVDPEVVSALVAHRDAGLASLSDREREVLRLMASGLSNRAITSRLHLSQKTVEAHVGAIFTKLGLVAAADDNRRVIAVLTYLRHVWA